MRPLTSLDLIRLAYDPELMRHCGERMSRLMADHLATCQRAEGPVQHWVTPDLNERQALGYLENRQARSGESEASEGDLVEQFQELVQVSLRQAQRLHHPRCVGHQVPASVPLAGLFDALTALTNQVQGVYEMGPWSVAVERAVLAKMGETLGFRAGEFGSLVTSGGSLANLTALLAARDHCFEGIWQRGNMAHVESVEQLGNSSQCGNGGTTPAPVLVVNADAHYCIERAAGVMGMGTDNVLRVPVDSDRRMSVAALESTLNDLRRRGVPVIAVVAVAGTTAVGAFDPIHAIADVCRRFGVWLHVDAAHGGALCFSRRHRHWVDGLHLADSVVVDAHKMMFVPAVCAMLFYRNRAHRFSAFHQSAPYLFDPSAPEMAEYDNAVVTFECTKRASALGLWGIWSLFGPDFFEAMIDGVIDVARELYEKLVAADFIETFQPPSCNIVVFRAVPPSLREANAEVVDRHQLWLRRRLLEQGAAYLTQTRIDGRIYLRATIMNPLTDSAALDCILRSLREESGQHAADWAGQCHA